MTPQPPTPAEQSNALALIAKAASDPALGDAAAVGGQATGGTPVALQDAALVTSTNDQTWRASWLLFTSAVPGPAGQDRSVMVGQDRYLFAVEGNTGTLRWVHPTPWPAMPGDGYLLLRDFRFARWLQWLNETARNLHYPVDVVVTPNPDAQNVLRYPLPPPIERAGWLESVWFRQQPSDPDPATGAQGRAANTIPAGYEARWHRVDVTSAEGDAYVTLSRPVAQHQEIVFRARPPFAFEWETPYARWDSVLVPAGRDPATGAAIRPPVRLFEMGVTWRAMQAKLAPLTGAPRQMWQQNLERFARRYAEACEEWRRKEEDRTLGYKEDWFPQGTATAWSLP